jgi:hypothetical protein
MKPPQGFTGAPAIVHHPAPQRARVVDNPPRQPRQIEQPQLILYPDGQARLNTAMAIACGLSERCPIELVPPLMREYSSRTWFLDTRKTAPRFLSFDIQEGSKFRTGYTVRGFFANPGVKKLVFTLAPLSEEDELGYFRLERVKSILGRQKPTP